jgi:hypothetical protein
VLKEGRIPTEKEDIEEFFSRPDYYEPVTKFPFFFVLTA